MKLDEIQMDNETMQALATMIGERLKNHMAQLKGGGMPIELLMGELCVIEAKLDAFMQMCEDKQNLSFAKFNEYLKRSALGAAQAAIDLRTHMASMQKNGPSGIVKPDGKAP